MGAEIQVLDHGFVALDAACATDLSVVNSARVSLHKRHEETCRLWLREAEKMAGVEHVDGLAFHGIRRVVSDLMYEELGLDAMTTAMAWSTRSTPEQIYVDRLRMGDRVMARQAMERKRSDDGS